MSDSKTEAVGSFLESAIPFLQHKADEVITHGVFTPMVTAAAVWGGLGTYDYFKSRREIKKGKLNRDFSTVSQTLYSPTGLLRPDSTDEYFDQRFVMQGKAYLHEIFGKAVWRGLRKPMYKAQDAVTRAEPSPFQHIHKFVKPKDLAATEEVILRSVRNHFSTAFNGGEALSLINTDGRERAVAYEVLPLYVMEPGAKNNEGRWLLIKVKNDEFPFLPERKNVRFSDLKAEGFAQKFEDNQGNFHGDRYDTLSVLYAALDDDKASWIRNFAVDVYTDKRVTIPVPLPNYPFIPEIPA